MFETFNNSNIVIFARQVNSAEHSWSTKFVELIMDMRNWEHIKASLLIQIPEINRHLELSCIFPHKYGRATIGQDAVAKLALYQYVVYMLGNQLNFIGNETILLVVRQNVIFIY